MIPSAVSAAIGDLFSREARAVFAKTLFVTLLVLAAVWFGLQTTYEWLLMPWVDAGIHRLPSWASFLEPLATVLVGITLAIGLALLLAPTTALVAGLFLDDLADVIERRDYPGDPPGQALPPLTAALLSVKFLGVVLLGNLVALALLLIPGVNLIAFFAVNGYMLGREFFEFAALRFHTEADAKALRRRHAGTVFAAGLLIAAWLAVPVLNLLTPLFAAALMVHLHKALSSRPTRR